MRIRNPGHNSNLTKANTDLAILDCLGEEESKGGEADLLFTPAQGLVQDARLRSKQNNQAFIED